MVELNRENSEQEIHIAKKYIFRSGHHPEPSQNFKLKSYSSQNDKLRK